MPTEAQSTGKADGDVLFPEVQVAGYTVRPWTFGDTVALAPEFRGMIKVIREEKIGFEDLEERFPEVVTLLLPFGSEIVRKTLKISNEEVGKLGPDKALLVLLTIINQNLDYLKNSFGLGLPTPLKKAMEALKVG